MGRDRVQPPTQSFHQALQTLIELRDKIYKGTNFNINIQTKFQTIGEWLPTSEHWQKVEQYH